ncbi:hypothetical protein V6N13_032755 [Hibiscus sabdariffa]
MAVVYSVVRVRSSTTLLSPPSSPRAGAGKPLLPMDKVDEHKEKEKNKPVTYPHNLLLQASISGHSLLQLCSQRGNSRPPK